MTGIARIILALLLLLPAVPIHAARLSDLGQAGRTYQIAEPDAMLEIQQAAAAVDWEKTIDREKMKERIRAYRPEDLRVLPTATKERIRLVDMTYTLPMDIPDGRGGILYPAGFSFNPLDYQSLTGTIVVIDGNDPLQVEWFVAEHAESFRTRLIITGGAYHELIEALDRPVFYLPAEMADRMQLAAVPSVIRQRGRMMEVREIVLPVESQQDEVTP